MSVSLLNICQSKICTEYWKCWPYNLSRLFICVRDLHSKLQFWSLLGRSRWIWRYLILVGQGLSDVGSAIFISPFLRNLKVIPKTCLLDFAVNKCDWSNSLDQRPQWYCTVSPLLQKNCDLTISTILLWEIKAGQAVKNTQKHLMSYVNC